MLEERRLVLPLHHAERIPTSTPAGLIDVPANLALLFETLYERRHSALLPRVQTVTPERGVKAVKEGLAILDRALERVHEKSQPGGTSSTSGSP